MLEFNVMKAKWSVLTLVSAVFLCWTGILFANYTIVLKNGRRITVKSYQEEGEMIKVRGMGGEFGIAKDQIESIINPGADEERGMVVPDSNRIQPTVTSRQTSKSTPPKDSGKDPEGEVPEKKGAAPPDKDAEEAEYLRRIKEITAQIKGLTDRYSVAIKGSSDPGSKRISHEEASRLIADKGGKLSGLRKQINQLRKERKKLIQEMKQKNFDTASFLLGE